MVLLQQQKRFEHGARFAPEEPFVARFEQLVVAIEARVDFADRAAAHGENKGAEVLQHDGVQLTDFQRGAVKALHQMLARTPVGGVAQPHLRRQRGLHVEHQALFAPPREVMQADAQVLQKCFVLPEQARFAAGDDFALDEIRPARADAGRLGDPQYRLQVAQPSGGLLDVGFEVGIVIAHVALFLLEPFGLGELLGIERAQKFFFKLPEELALPREQARLQEARLDGDVLRGERHALGYGAHAVSDIEPYIPKETDELLELLRERLVGGRGQQYQQVDIRVGEELPAAITADCRQRHAVRHRHLLPDDLEVAVHELAMLAQQLGCGSLFQVALLQQRAAFCKPLAQPRAGRLRRGRRGRQQLRRANHAARGRNPARLACRRIPSALHSRPASPARCAPIGPTGCGLW